VTFFANLLQITLELAPWLLLGSAVAGGLHVGLPEGFVARHFRGRGSVLLAVLLGVPLPLCSCGVIPAALGLKRDGASDGATIGFLISTPQTGVDSFLVSAAFLGWPFALFKVGSAALMGMVGGLLADWGTSGTPAPPPAPTCVAPVRRGWRDGLHHAVELLRSIWAWLVLGVFVSAAITTWVPAYALSSLAAGGTWAALLLALVVSVPLYVCATASVPIAAALVGAGLPAGAALVFLMAGPATNVATLGAVGRGLGRRALGIYLGTIVVGSLGLAYLFGQWIPLAGSHAGPHDHGAGVFSYAAAVVLVALLLAFAAADGVQWWAKLRAPGPAALVVSVEGMSCQGCVRKLERTLREEPGISAVTVHLERPRAEVIGAITVERLHALVREAGFRPVA